MKRAMLRSGAFLLVLILLSTNTVGAKTPLPIDAQAEVDKCWALSKEARDSGVTADMHNGTLLTIECFEDRIVDHMSALFSGKERATFFDGRTKLDRAGIRKTLKQMVDAESMIYWSIYNDHAKCRGNCGTMFTLFHLGNVAHTLEKLLQDVIRQRNQYGL